jgi:cytoskeletal protein CcmA (bactofilin family)
MADTNPEYPTIIGPDASFKGELTFEKGLRLQGKFDGQINTQGRLLVAKEARMHANVEAGAIIIEGDSARYEGDLSANKLVVDEGASLNGHVTVGPDAAKGRHTPAPVGMNRPTPTVTPPPNAPQPK